jgi:hypothetical protein
MTDKPKKSPKVRLNIRVPEKLLIWAKRHARKSHTTVTQIIVSRLTDLQRDHG